MEEQSIYRLLGLSADADVEHLRAAYEGAVATATARGDWKRAATLSSAFDALPLSVRLAVYGGRERDAGRWAPATQPIARTRRGSTRRNRFLAGILITGVLAIVAALAGAAGLSHRTTSTSAAVAVPTPPPETTSATALVPARTSNRASATPIPTSATWSPMRALYPGFGNVLIPTNALVDANGLAQVSCPEDPTSTYWHRYTTRPGKQFVCPSGYVGRVLMPAVQ